MKYWYDTEFLEDGTTIELISIGIVAEDERTYYAVNADASMDRIRQHMWLMTNVVPHLPIRGAQSLDKWLQHSRNSYPQPSVELVDLDRSNAQVRPKWVIANEIRDFLAGGGETRTKPAELWSYYAAYDHVALMQLWGPMIAKPAHLPMYTRDIQQEADWQGRSDDLPPAPVNAHDALADAVWHRAMWDSLAEGRRG